jgi:hypothetical protein
MAYNNEERVARMKELMKPIDVQIMMCDDSQDLLALASIMAVSAKNIYLPIIGKEGAREVFKTLLKEI